MSVEPVRIPAEDLQKFAAEALIGLVAGTQFDSLGVLAGFVEQVAANPGKSIADHHRDYAPDTVGDALAGGSNCIGLSQLYARQLGSDLGLHVPILGSRWESNRPKTGNEQSSFFKLGHAGAYLLFEDVHGPGALWVDANLLEAASAEILRPGVAVPRPNTNLYRTDGGGGSMVRLNEDGSIEDRFSVGSWISQPGDWLNPDRSALPGLIALGKDGWLVNRGEQAWLKVNPLKDQFTAGVDGYQIDRDLSDRRGVEDVVSEEFCRRLGRNRKDVMGPISTLQNHPEVTEKRRQFRNEVQAQRPQSQLLRAVTK